MTEYRYVGTYTADLANGRPLAPGDFVELSAEELDDEFNKRYIDEGLLIRSSGAAPKEQATEGKEA